METIHTTRQSSRKRKNTTQTNVIIAIVVHVLMIAAGAFWAAHEGILGAKLQNLAVFMVPKEKKVEEAKKPEPKVEAKKAEQPKAEQQQAKAAPAPAKFIASPPAASQANLAPPPPPVIGGEGLSFSPDALTSDDPIVFYKQQVENILRSRWERPAGVEDRDFTAEVEMHVDTQGKITGYDWKKGSGNQRWDNSVKQALTGAINRPPPKGFPDKFLVRFDVQPATEPLISRAD